MTAAPAREKAGAAEKARAALLAALDPHGDVDYGLAVAITWQLDDDAASVLAELVDKRVAAERERIAAGIGQLKLAPSSGVVPFSDADAAKHAWNAGVDEAVLVAYLVGKPPDPTLADLDAETEHTERILRGET